MWVPHDMFQDWRSNTEARRSRSISLTWPFLNQCQRFVPKNMLYKILMWVPVHMFQGQRSNTKARIFYYENFGALNVKISKESAKLVKLTSNIDLDLLASVFDLRS